VNSVCLPSRAAPTPNYRMTVSGWGRESDARGATISDRLKDAVVETKTDAMCYWSYVADQFICAADVSGTSCNGDSGSFVGSVRDGRYEQDALVSFGGFRCQGYDMGMTEVYTYLDWIKKTIKNN